MQYGPYDDLAPGLSCVHPIMVVQDEYAPPPQKC